MKTNYIYLSEDQQEYLKDIVRNGVHNSHEITRARVLLMLDRTGKADHVRYKRIAEYTNLSVQAVYNMRDEYLQKQNIDSYLTRKKRETGPRDRKLDGTQEAQIIALACSEVPEGYGHWSVRLLSSRAVALGIVDSISHMTIQRLLKKHNISLI